MATVSHYPLVNHLRSEPNQFILHYRGGRVVRRGAGLAYWFSPLSAAIAQLPVEDVETTFVLTERTADYQDVSVQCTLIYRVVDAEVAASRNNFTVSLKSGSWIEEPLQHLASFWSQRARRPARAYLTGVPLVDAVGRGAEVIRAAIEDALRTDPEIAAMGLALVSVHVQRVAATPDVEKALQTPIREAIQQRADEATFARRAQAVENERAPNVAKYLDGQLVLGINPDPARFDGILCPHRPSEMQRLLAWLQTRDEGTFRIQERTMAMVQREDGQHLLALNEVFVGHHTHQSARYRLCVGQREERQSSSGIICATGTGSTGWARSIARQRHIDLSL